MLMSGSHFTRRHTFCFWLWLRSGHVRHWVTDLCQQDIQNNKSRTPARVMITEVVPVVTFGSTSKNVRNGVDSPFLMRVTVYLKGVALKSKRKGVRCQYDTVGRLPTVGNRSERSSEAGSHGAGGVGCLERTPNPFFVEGEVKTVTKRRKPK